MELARPAPLQEVAEGPTCLAAPQPLPAPIHELIIEDRNGLSDDEGPEELEYYPRLTMGSSVLVDGAAPSSIGSSQSPQRHLHAHVQDGRQPLTEGLSDASTETSSEGRHSNRSTPVFKYRHDPYSFNVLPANFVFEESIPRRLEVPAAFKATNYTEDDWDAPQAIRATTSPAPQPAPPAATSSRLIPIDDYPQPLSEESQLYPEPQYFDAGVTIHQSSQHAHNPNASASSGPRTMCCYFKQFGRCKMGEDRCWYSHDGDESTPCHYGALCKAGHAHLVKNGATHAQPHRPAQPQVPVQPQGFRTHMEPSHAQPMKRVAPGPQYPSGALLFSDIQCTECGDFVRVQEFPAYEGDRRYTAFRAHCVNCLHTFVL